MFVWLPWVDDEDPLVAYDDSAETQALEYYKRTGNIPRNTRGEWLIDYIPKSLNRIDQQRWMFLSDGKLQIQK